MKKVIIMAIALACQTATAAGVLLTSSTDKDGELRTETAYCDAYLKLCDNPRSQIPKAIHLNPCETYRLVSWKVMLGYHNRIEYTYRVYKSMQRGCNNIVIAP